MKATYIAAPRLDPATLRHRVALFACLCLAFTAARAEDAARAARPVATPSPATAPAIANGPVLKSGSRLAIIGDSITQQKIYTRYIEAYLLLCTPLTDLHIMNYGWSDENALGFLNRMDNDLTPFHPTTVTICLGMNDGGYRALDENNKKDYEVPMREMVRKLAATGVTCVLGSPGTVDTVSFRGGKESARIYNETLGAYTEFDRKLAEEFRQPFADLHTPMMSAMTKAKQALGDAMIRNCWRALMAYPIQAYSRNSRQLYKELLRINREEIPKPLYGAIDHL